MKLNRIVVSDISNPIKFWMTEEQTEYFSNFLIKADGVFHITRSNYEILTGISK